MNFVDVALQTDGCVGKAKEYYLVLEMTVSGVESRFLLVTFSESHPMIDTS